MGDFDSAIEQYKAIISAKHRLIAIPFIYNNKKSETQNRAIAYYNMGKAYYQKAFYLPKEDKIERKEFLLQLYLTTDVAYEIILSERMVWFVIEIDYNNSTERGELHDKEG